MSVWLLDVAHVATDLLGAYDGTDVGSEEDAPWILLLLGPAGAVGVYWGLYRYYRNTDKSHAFEKETHIEAQPVTGQDRKIDTVRGTKRTKVKGDNVSQHRTRVQRLH